MPRALNPRHASPSSTPAPRGSATTLKLLTALALAAMVFAQALPRPTDASGADVAAGYGSATVGGAGGRLINVSTADAFAAALAASGPRIVQVAAGLYDVGKVRVKDPYLTVVGQPGAVIKGSILVVTDQVILRGLSVLPGDQWDDPAALDAVTINGMSGSVSNVVLDHLTMLWGPDIGGLAILGDVSDVTVQH
ncbi:MAG TPA: hypothetical protein VHK28_00750, partial [Candidatus Limnocylindria bacterium]|nr:hypothetical protein [Candidatus Limnocylindria bacterium]